MVFCTRFCLFHKSNSLFPNIFFMQQVQILFEETFFNQNEESYHVLCIDQLFDGGGEIVQTCFHLVMHSVCS